MDDIIFEDRRDAGRRLAKVLIKQKDFKQPLVVLGIPRGGLVVADEVAEAMSAFLDVIIVRKLRAPFQPELGIGAVVNGDHISIVNEELVRAAGVSSEYLEQEVAYQQREVERRLQLYRGDCPALDVSGKTVIVSTMVLRRDILSAQRWKVCADVILHGLLLQCQSQPGVVSIW